MGLSLSSPSSDAVSPHRSGHVYTSVATQDNAQAHYGDRITVQNYHASFSLWPKPPSDRAGELSSPERRAPKRKLIEDADTEGPLREGQDPVNMAIDHLGELCMHMRHFEKDRDAQRLVRWIRVLIGAFANGNADSRLEHTLNGLESLQHGLMSVNRISINSMSTSRRNTPAHMIEVHRKSSVVVVGTWEIQLDTTSCDSVDSTGRDVNESFSSLRLRPTGVPGSGRVSVSVFFGERADYFQRSFLSPTIIAYRTVDSSSEVFDLVRRDDVDGLIRHIALQKASARDCDANGRSLLFLACCYGSRACCKFLIDCGVDVNRADADMLDVGRSSTPLHMAVHGQMSLTIPARPVGIYSDRDRGDQIELVQSLIEAEADPTSIAASRAGLRSPLAMALNSLEDGFVMPLQQLVPLMLNGIYADLQTIDLTSGLSIWLLASMNPQPSYLRTLLSAGCDVAETCAPSQGYAREEGWLGWNCLFHLLESAHSPYSSRELEALQLLIISGADPFLRDAAGCTIFDYMDKENHSHLGSYQRDLWYSALRKAHVHINRPMGTGQNVPVYEIQYTPLHYRALCHLDSWDSDTIETQVAPLLEKSPWSQYEAEAIARIAEDEAKAIARIAEETSRAEARLIDADKPAVYEK